MMTMLLFSFCLLELILWIITTHTNDTMMSDTMKLRWFYFSNEDEIDSWIPRRTDVDSIMNLPLVIYKNQPDSNAQVFQLYFQVRSKKLLSIFLERGKFRHGKSYKVMQIFWVKTIDILLNMYLFQRENFFG